MHIETKCDCKVIVKPSVEHFTKYFPYSLDIKLCKAHKAELVEDSKIKLEQLHSKTIQELGECL